ncbi:hypothetical protein COY2906_04280 [Lactiplantibacillus plantarum]|nr:hypothetical protein COY2906_04280 [Lactiplantibacillus plantarum]
MSINWDVVSVRLGPVSIFLQWVQSETLIFSGKHGKLEKQVKVGIFWSIERFRRNI